MRLKFNHVKITGIYSLIPNKIRFFDDEIANYEFSPETSLKLKESMGYNAHRIFDNDITEADLAEYALRQLNENNRLDLASIDALILVTETPDYIVPPTSNVIQGRLGLKEDMICLDINQGCAGFEVGLIESFMLLQQENIHRVALINCDLLGRKVSIHDRNSYPLIGDALSVTILDKTETDSPVFVNIRMDGKGAFAIQIPAGGSAMPCSPETAKMEKDRFGNLRSLDNLVMKGDDVFMFVQKRVPPLIMDILEYASADKEDIDMFMFHQPNKFMLTKLGKKLKIPMEKLPSNIVENFGNSSGVTVPLNITYNLGKQLLDKTMRLCVAGFGVGLVWSSAIMNVGPLQFCEMHEYPSKK